VNASDDIPGTIATHWGNALGVSNAHEPRITFGLTSRRIQAGMLNSQGLHEVSNYI